MIIYLWGEDTYRSREHLHLIRQKFIRERDPSAMNTSRIDLAESAPAATLFGEIYAAPFLADRRMVVLEHVFASKKDVATELLAHIEENKIPESTVLVLWHDGGAPKGKEYKALHERLIQEKFAQAFERLEGAKLAGWIGAAATERGLTLAPPAIQYLVSESGGSTWQIGALLDQLSVYLAASGQKNATLDHVLLFFAESSTDHLFALIDAIVARQPKQVYALLREQYALGDDAGKIAAMITRQIRILLELRDLYDRSEGLSSDVVAKELGLHPYVVKKSLSLVRQYPRHVLERLHADMLDDDIHLKTGYANAETLLEERIGQLLYRVV